MLSIEPPAGGRHRRSTNESQRDFSGDFNKLFESVGKSPWFRGSS